MLAIPFIVLSALALALRGAAATTVFAHFMVTNAYAYDVDQWKTDMQAAQDIGIDGFALNWIPPDCPDTSLGWTVDRIDDAFNAAQSMNFKLMYSFDMSYSECHIYWNQTFMQQMISKYAGNSATYRWNSNILVSTYGGDFVSQYGNSFFQTLKDNMKHSNAITLAPALTRYSMSAQYNSAQAAASKLISDFPSVDGYFNWQAWPLNFPDTSTVTPNLTVTADQSFQSTLRSAGKSGPYIMAVSPWQYKDLNDGNNMDSWVAPSDTLFADRFEQITGEGNFQPDIIELLTWNDYCESHYLRDLPNQFDKSAKDYVQLGDMGAYVWGQDHSAWRVMAKYYIFWWKNGYAPAVTEDQVVYWYRIHPKNTICEAGSSVRNNQTTQDAVFAWALVKDQAEISLSLGSNKYWNFQADSGKPATGTVPFPLDELSGDGLKPEVAIMRGDKLVSWSQGAQAIVDNCAYSNFNPVVNLVGNSMS